MKQIILMGTYLVAMCSCVLMTSGCQTVSLNGHKLNSGQSILLAAGAVGIAGLALSQDDDEEEHVYHHRCTTCPPVEREELK